MLTDWGLLDNVKAICCDTTPSNLGHLQGAATLVEQMLQKNLLYLPCRHYIYELVLRSVFDKKMQQCSGPNVPIYTRFKNSLKNMVQTEYSIGLENEYVKQNLESYLDEIETFINKNLKQSTREMIIRNYWSL